MYRCKVLSREHSGAPAVLAERVLRDSRTCSGCPHWLSALPAVHSLLSWFPIGPHGLSSSLICIWVIIEHFMDCYFELYKANHIKFDWVCQVNKFTIDFTMVHAKLFRTFSSLTFKEQNHSCKSFSYKFIINCFLYISYFSYTLVSGENTFICFQTCQQKVKINFKQCLLSIFYC